MGVIYIMKLTRIHLFIILVLSLILASSLGLYMKEGMQASPTLPAALQPVDTRAPKSSDLNGGVAIGGANATTAASSPGDQYILKSEIVPTYGGAGMTADQPADAKCPPCPACARCPEPSTVCKAVPNYSRPENSGLPMPVMADFSQFGM